MVREGDKKRLHNSILEEMSEKVFSKKVKEWVNEKEREKWIGRERKGWEREKENDKKEIDKTERVRVR